MKKNGDNLLTKSTSGYWQLAYSKYVRLILWLLDLESLGFNKRQKTLHREIVLIANKFPREYLYLADQIKRSSLSIILNIAEGSSKQSDKDFNRYIAISLGSVDETVACLEIALDLNLIKQSQFEKFEIQLESLSNQLGALSKSLRRSYPCFIIG